MDTIKDEEEEDPEPQGSESFEWTEIPQKLVSQKSGTFNPLALLGLRRKLSELEVKRLENYYEACKTLR